MYFLSKKAQKRSPNLPFPLLMDAHTVLIFAFSSVVFLKKKKWIITCFVNFCICFSGKIERYMFGARSFWQLQNEFE